MPFYEMKCKECNYEVEMLLNITDDLEAVKCPKCDNNMKVQITTGNFILEGFGWASKGNKEKPHREKQVGYKVDYDKKNAMREAGERV